MNKAFHHIIAGSVLALLIAGGGCMWLVWQSMEESRALERQNRELLASLEASRIRVENFCEYPVEALCQVEDKKGSVVNAMADFSAAPAEESPASTPSSALIADKANTEEKLPSAPVTEKKPLTALPEPAVEAKPAPKAPESIVAAVSEPVTPAPAEAKSNVPAPILAVDTNASAPAESSSTETLTAEKKPAEEVIPAPAAPAEVAAPSADAPAQEAAPSPEPSPSLLEVSGKITLLQHSDNVKDAAPHTLAEKAVPTTSPAKSPAVGTASPKISTDNVSRKAVKAAPAKQVAPQSAPTILPAKMTWSRVEKDGDIFVFTISGAGSHLPAEGRLLAKPWCYELTLKGRWEVKAHAIPDNRLVKSMSRVFKGGNTILRFHLTGKPYRCSIHRQDARTVSIRIR